MDRRERGLRNVVIALVPVMALLAIAVTPISSQQVGGLSKDFYHASCPNLTEIVRNAMNITAELDPVNLPALLRLFAHDAMVNGVDGSILLDSKATAKSPADKAEKDAPINLSLFGFEAVNFVKGKVEESCPRTVSCADVLTLTAQFAVEMSGGPAYESLLGRRDSKVSRYLDAVAQLPTETMSLDQLSANFASKGLNMEDLVALSGAHTIGFAHCEAFANRIYNFSGTGQMDPSMDWTLGEQLMSVCPKKFDPTTVQALDITTIEKFDEGYYFNLQINEGLLSSDQVLLDSPETSGLVDSFANDKQAFFDAFVASMEKLSSVGVLTGSQGEIRQVCSRVNASPPPPPRSSPPPPKASPPPPPKASQTPPKPSPPPPAPKASPPSPPSSTPPPPTV